VKLGKRKGKALGGAPRAGKWTRDTPESRRFGGEHHGSFILLLVTGVAFVVTVAVVGVLAQQRLNDGVVGQYRRSLRRHDWVPLARMSPAVLPAFLAVVDTTSFQRLSPYGRQERPELTNDLVVQVHRLRGGIADQAWRSAMVPLVEAQLSRRAALEFYLNRIYLGKTGDWPVYGVKHAAEEYFGKDVRGLSVGEAATLAGILLPPRLVNPENNPGAVGARRNEVLRRMLAAGNINEHQYRTATAEPLAFQPGIDYAAMTRPVDWGKERPVIRLPSAGATAAADPAAAQSPGPQ
jgi:penicillin-binding protein 1A